VGIELRDQPQPKIATRDEVLEMLTEKARAGQTSAMIALERALRNRSRGLRNEPYDDGDDDWFERLLENGVEDG
jgi:hypothetical protein